MWYLYWETQFYVQNEEGPCNFSRSDSLFSEMFWSAILQTISSSCYTSDTVFSFLFVNFSVSLVYDWWFIAMQHYLYKLKLEGSKKLSNKGKGMLKIVWNTVHEVFFFLIPNMMRSSKCTQYVCVMKLMVAFIFSYICVYFLNIFCCY